MLNKVGIAWTVLANNHLARTLPGHADCHRQRRRECATCPTPPTRSTRRKASTITNASSIARGCSPTQVMPFGFQLHYARYVDPDTGNASVIILVPADQVFGWDDSY